jgi:hypothetical protein
LASGWSFAAHQREVVAHEPLHLDLGAGPLGRADAEVHVLAEDARDELVGRAVVDQHANFRMLFAEAADRRGQQEGGQRGRDGQGHAAALQRGQFAKTGGERIDVAQDALGHGQHFVGRRRRLERARGAVEQARAQPLLELADQHAHRRLGDEEPLRGRAELAQLVHREERAQLADRRAERRTEVFIHKAI